MTNKKAEQKFEEDRIDEDNREWTFFDKSGKKFTRGCVCIGER